jgi:glutathione S-transferase
MSKRVLYGHPLSGNVHKVRLALSMLGLPYEEVLVDITKPREQSYLKYVRLLLPIFTIGVQKQ